MRSKVRLSCQALCSSNDCLAIINETQIEPFLGSIKEDHYRHVLQQEKAQLSFPLKWDSIDQRLNFYAILHLLNFGSGYRIVLKAANGSGAFDNIIKLLISLHLSGEQLDASWMMRIDAAKIGELMRLPMTKDVATDNPILKQVVPSAASTVAHKVAAALNSTGRVLREQHKLDLITFVKAAIADSGNIDELMTALSAIPTLADTHTVCAMTVHLNKKMQVMLSELQRQGLDIPCIEAGDLTVFADNVLPTMLQHYGLIACPSADQKLSRDEQLTPEESASLRAASIVVSEQIYEASREHFAWIGTEVDLDNYLWRVAKDPELRKLPRYVDQETSFF